MGRRWTGWFGGTPTLRMNDKEDPARRLGRSSQQGRKARSLWSPGSQVENVDHNSCKVKQDSESDHCILRWGGQTVELFQVDEQFQWQRRGESLINPLGRESWNSQRFYKLLWKSRKCRENLICPGIQKLMKYRFLDLLWLWLPKAVSSFSLWSHHSWSRFFSLS